MFCIVDIETTGGRQNDDRITEIAIIVHNGEKIVEEFTSLVNPCKPIHPFVVSLTGISDDMVRNAPVFGDIAQKVLSLTENKVFVAHNVSFDYGIIRREFNKIGINFQRKHLCTVKLSRKIMPGYKSYSLGNICQDLNIPNLDRHRAYGDAFATTLLLEKIMSADSSQIINSLIEEEVQTHLLPPNVSKDIMDNIPEMTGVYQFLDQNRKILFVGKSRNIRKRLLSHFSNDFNKKYWLKLKNSIYDIQYQITGSELLAELIESEEIKRYAPPFNTIQRRRNYRYALTLSKDQEGYYQLSIDGVNSDKRQIKKFISKVAGQKFLDSWMNKYIGSAAFKKILTVEKYNEMVERALEKLTWLKEDSIVLLDGKSHDENGFILIENRQIKGYGFVEKETGIENDSDLSVHTNDILHKEEANSILLKHLSKNKEVFKIVPKKNNKQ
jgi:DNA polymerase-3 subunit epsilon